MKEYRGAGPGLWKCPIDGRPFSINRVIEKDLGEGACLKKLLAFASIKRFQPLTTSKQTGNKPSCRKRLLRQLLPAFP